MKIKMMIISNELSLVPWLWLLLAIISCLTEPATSVSPNNYTVGALLPSSTSANHIVMESGYFQVDVRSWNSKTSPGYRCMAGVKHTKINPGSTIWAAHGALPVAHRCQLRLSPTGLSLINMDDNAAAADWSTPTFKNVANMTLLESGNLVLQDSAGDVVWQSFHQTTVFAILPGMNFTTNYTLYSTDVSPDATGVDDWSVAPGSYALRLHEDGIVYLYLSRDAARADSSAGDGGFVYWSYNVYNNKSASNPKVSYMALDRNMSVIHFFDAQSRLIDSAATLPPSPPAKPDGLDTNIAIIEHSGGYFSIFDYVSLNETNKFWTTAYNASDVAASTSLCQIFSSGSCGSFSLCHISNGSCYCPDGFYLGSDRSCVPENAIEPNCSTASDYSYEILRVPNVLFPPQLPPLPTASSEAQCDDLCRQNCNCSAALYDPSSSTCALFSAIRAVPTYDTHSGSSSDQVLLLKIALYNSKSKRNIIILAALLCAAVVLAICCCLVILCIMLRRRRRRKAKDDWEMEFLEVMPRLPPRFSLKEMEAATQGFSAKLGSGGFGCVYEGALPSGQKIAVKKLEFVGEGNEVNRRRYIQTFRAELVSISAASHVNLVTLRGFCIDEGSKLLVYEYMANGSLDRWLFPKEVDRAELNWRRRFSIALDTAKGLAYLHHECAERIVHCDIKPENILLDEKFRAKVADFGLAKLMESEKQGFTMTTVKGTRGYLAPEWLQESTITTKSDVYSYGVVLLELISGRRCLDAGGYLPVVAMQALANSIRSQSTASSSDEKQSKSTLSSSDEKLYRSGIVSVVQSLLDERLSNVCAKQNIEELNLMKGKHECTEVIGNVEEDDSRAAAMERMVVVALWCVQRDPALRPTMAAVVQMLEGKEEVPPPVLRSAAGEAMIYLGDIIYDDRVRFSGQGSAATLDSEWASTLQPR